MPSVSGHFTGIKSAVMLYIIMRTLSFLPCWLHTTPHTQTNVCLNGKWNDKAFRLCLPFTKDLDADDIYLCILYNSLNLILYEKGSSTHSKNKVRLVYIDKHFGCWRPGDAWSHVTARHTWKQMSNGPFYYLTLICTLSTSIGYVIFLLTLYISVYMSCLCNVFVNAILTCCHCMWINETRNSELVQVFCHYFYLLNSCELTHTHTGRVTRILLSVEWVGIGYLNSLSYMHHLAIDYRSHWWRAYRQLEP